MAGEIYARIVRLCDSKREREHFKMYLSFNIRNWTVGTRLVKDISYCIFWLQFSCCQLTVMIRTKTAL
jgi:hypothetical protein